MAFTEKETEILKRYISNPNGNIFVVNLPSHITGALFTRYSRATTGLRETSLKEFIDENGNLKISHADELIERILIQYGDDSVEELEGLHVALEQISNLAAKKIEDKRIGCSPIEQSTRYVFYDERDENGNFKYLREKKIMQSSFADEYIRTMEFLFQSYSDLVKPMQEFFRKLKSIEEVEYAIKPNNPKKYNISELSEEREIKDFKRTYNFDIRTKACDTIRCLLPASTLTNVGIFGNGRFFHGLIDSLYSDSLTESNKIATLLHEELNKFIPKYVKRASYKKYLAETEKNMRILTSELLKNETPEKEEDVVLLENRPEEYLDNLIAQMLYSYSEHPLIQLRNFIKQLDTERKKEIIKTYIGNRTNRRDRPGRALEFGYPFTFDIVADFGIYRDMHRQRMKTQQRQNLTTRRGKVIPEEIFELGQGYKEKVLECFEHSESLYEKLVKVSPLEAQYVILFGHKIRWSQGENLRELMHELELRTVPQGHPNYRKLCQEMHKKVKESYPSIIAETLKFVDHNDYYWSRAESEAKQRRKERELELKLKNP